MFNHALDDVVLIAVVAGAFALGILVTLRRTPPESHALEYIALALILAVFAAMIWLLVSY